MLCDLPSRATVGAGRAAALTFLDIIPQLILAGAFLKGFWEFDRTRAEVPEQDPKGVDVHGVVVLPCKKRQWSSMRRVLHAAGGRAGDGTVPVNSSGAMWMGVPTMLPDIMASGLQKPRSVIFARFCLSNFRERRTETAEQ